MQNLQILICNEVEPAHRKLALLFLPVNPGIPLLPKLTAQPWHPYSCTTSSRKNECSRRFQDRVPGVLMVAETVVYKICNFNVAHARRVANNTLNFCGLYISDKVFRPRNYKKHTVVYLNHFPIVTRRLQLLM